MLDVNDEEPADVEEVIEVVTTAKLITKVVTTAKDDVIAASVEVPKPRKREGVIIQDPKETTTTVTVQPKREKLTYAVMNYQALKRKPLTEVQARRNIIVYLKNMAGYKRNYFKGMTYNEIRPIFEKHYNYNQAFLNEVNKEVKFPKREVRQEKEVEVESSKREGESLEKEPNVEANVWKDQKGKYGLAKVKSWKLIESCGVHWLTLSTTQVFLLVERMYPLTHFTLEQIINDVRLEVEDENKMSL
nr:hypothetical protein [Tanacetum cinerariifolium]